MSQLKNRENSSNKLTAGGDGIRKRVPVPSSRKFTPIRNNKSNDNIKNDLLLALNELENRKVPKAKSMAEITPTKTKSRQENRSKDKKETSLVALHATPRDSLTGYLNKKSAARIIFKHLLLFSWRSFRSQLHSLKTTSQQQEEQILQLKMQVDVLENLRQAETNRSNEKTLMCQQLKNELVTVQQENEALIKDQANNEKQINQLQEKVLNLVNNLEDVKNELANEREIVIQSYEHSASIAFEVLLNRTRRNAYIENKLDVQNEKLNALMDNLKEFNLARRDDTIIFQSAANEDLHNTIENMTQNWRNLEILWNKECLENQSLERDVENLNKIISNLESTINDLNMQILVLNNKKESWSENAVKFGKSTWIILLKLATILLPAFNY